MVSHIQKYYLLLFLFLLSTGVALAEGDGRIVALEDWEVRMPVLIIIMVGTLIITSIFAFGAIRRMNDADYK